jgi:hypothetical protein
MLGNRSGRFDLPAHFEQGPNSAHGELATSEEVLSKAERYRKAVTRYSELAKQAEPGYLAEVYRKIAMQYLLMAGDLSKWADGPRSDA